MTTIIDSDQHLSTSPTALWAEHIDPAHRHEALSIVDDELGYPWLTWRDRRLDMADVQLPGETVTMDKYRGALPPAPAARSTTTTRHCRLVYWVPPPVSGTCRSLGLDEAVVFPNFGLLWERRLSVSLPTLTANMAAWNRWCATVVRRQWRPTAPGRPPHPQQPGVGFEAQLRAEL